MGYEILYCRTCQSQVRGADLERGTAVRVDGYPYCPACAKTLPKPAPTPPASQRRHLPRKISSDRIPVPHPNPAAPRRPRLLVACLSAAGLLLLFLLGFAFSSGKPPSPPSPDPAPVAKPPSPRPAPPPPPRISASQVVADLEKAAAAPGADPSDILLRCDQAKTLLAGLPEVARIPAVEERARLLVREATNLRQLEGVLEQLAKLRKEDPRFVRRNDTIALLESSRKIAGSRLPEVESALAAYLKDADAWQAEFGGLAAWYPFDDAAALAADHSRSERNGNAAGTAWDAVDGPRKGVLRIQGEAELVLPVGVREDFTISLWIRTRQAAPSGDQWFHGAGVVDAEYPGECADFGLALLGGRVAFGIGGTPDTTIKSKTDVGDDRWRHVAATYRASDGAMRLYMGGVLEAEGRGAAGTRSTPDRIVVGRLQTGGMRFTGSLDDLRFYARVLSDADVRSLASK